MQGFPNTVNAGGDEVLLLAGLRQAMRCGILSVPQDLILTLTQSVLVNLSLRNTHTHALG